MSLLDPRQFLLPAFYLDPTTQALLAQAASTSPCNKISSSSSFRISDILEQSPNNSSHSNDHGKSLHLQLIPKFQTFKTTAIKSFVRGALPIKNLLNHALDFLLSMVTTRKW